jgi:hypothetical protein
MTQTQSENDCSDGMAGVRAVGAEGCIIFEQMN